MQDLQEVFQRLQENKKKLKDLKASYRDALLTSQQYVEVSDELKVLKEKKKEIENVTRGQFAAEFMQIEDLKIDLASDMELISDIALTQIMKGETVAVKDEYENEYEPIIKVNFKKSA